MSDLSSASSSSASLLSAARESFRLIEPWTHASSNVPAVAILIQRVQEEASEYFTLLAKSVKTAEQGYSFSEDAGMLCTYLMDKDHPAEEVEEFIEYLQDVAQTAAKETREICNGFRHTRRALYDITREIPEEVDKLHTQRKHAIEKKGTAIRRADACKTVSSCCTAGSAVVSAGIALGAAVPFVLIVLPVILPAIALIGDGLSTHFQKKAAKRETEVCDCDQAVTLLRRASSNLKNLELCINGFADWWLEVDTMLAAIVGKVADLRAGRVPKLKLQVLKKNWADVMAMHLEYKITISRLLDHYRPPKDSAASPTLAKRSGGAAYGDGKGCAFDELEACANPTQDNASLKRRSAVRRPTREPTLKQTEQPEKAKTSSRVVANKHSDCSAVPAIATSSRSTRSSGHH